MPTSIETRRSPAQSRRLETTRDLRNQITQTHQIVHTVDRLHPPAAPRHSADFERRLSAFAADDNVLRLCLTRPESAATFAQKNFVWPDNRIISVGTRDQPVEILENTAKSALSPQVLVVLKIFVTTKCDMQMIQRLSNTKEKRIVATQAAYCLAMHIVHLRNEVREKCRTQTLGIYLQLKEWFERLANSGLNLNLQDGMSDASNYLLERLAASYLDDEIFEILVNKSLTKGAQIFIVNAENASKTADMRKRFFELAPQSIDLDSALGSRLAQQYPESLARIVEMSLACLKKEISGACASLVDYCCQYIFTGMLIYKHLDLLQQVLCKFATDPQFYFTIENVLHLSVQAENPEAVRICLNTGASATARLITADKWGFEAFEIDTRKGALHDLLRQKDIDISKVQRIIDIMCEYGADPRMLASGPVTNTKIFFERTPIDLVAHAARQGWVQRANFLAKYIARPTEKMRCHDEQCIKSLIEITEHALRNVTIGDSDEFRKTLKTLVVQAGRAHVDHGFGSISEAAAAAFYEINLLNSITRFTQRPPEKFASQQDQRNKCLAHGRSKLKLIKDYLSQALTHLHASASKKNALNLKTVQQVGYLGWRNELTKSIDVEFSYGALEIFVHEKQLEPLRIYCESGIACTLAALRRAFALSLCSTHGSEKNQRTWAKSTSPFTDLLIRYAQTPAAAFIILRCAIELHAEASCIAVIENIRRNDIAFWQVARSEEDASLLHMAIDMGEATLQGLLSIILDDALLKKWLEWGDEEGDTVFHLAAVHSAPAMHLLLKAAHRVGASVHSTNIEGRSALMEALACGHITVLEALWSRKNAMFSRPETDAKQLVAHVVEGFFQGDINNLRRFAKLPKGDILLREHLVSFVMHVIDHNRLDLLELLLQNYTHEVEENITQFRDVLYTTTKRGNARPYALFQTYLQTDVVPNFACDVVGADVGLKRKVEDQLSDRAVGQLANSVAGELPRSIDHRSPSSKEVPFVLAGQALTAMFCFAWRDRILDVAATRTGRMAVLDEFLQHCIGLPKQGKAWNELAVEEGYAIMTALYRRDRKGGAGRHVTAHLPTVSLAQLRQRLGKKRLSGSSRFGRSDSIDILLGLQQVKRNVRDYSETTARRQCIEYFDDNLSGEGYVVNARSGEVNYFGDSHRLAIIVEMPFFDSDHVECVSIYPLPNTVRPNQSI